VIGDQSSGKSSVLQAITRIPFPINEDMCTRFATEVSLHRSPPGYPTATSLSVKIDPEHVQEYSEEHRRRISEWESHNGHVTDELDPQSFARVLNEVKIPKTSKNLQIMLISKASNVILGGHTDRNVLDNVTLCISQTGPDKPNLTIVDLPGLVSGKQSTEDFSHYLPR
jgi:hypothetical protein